jgi:hypothetical protein
MVGERGTYTDLEEKREGKRTLGGSDLRWKGNIKIDI